MKKKTEYTDLFGKPIVEDELLRDKYIEPPFSVLDSRSGHWKKRKKLWLSRGIRSECGRNPASWLSTLKNWTDEKLPQKAEGLSPVSVFDPVLTELMYSWFCPDGGKILDPFAGGSVRGVVANYLGYNYTGIDLSARQIEANREQALEILGVDNMPNWYVGDSAVTLDGFIRKYDFVLSCPPYHDMEIYSDDKRDLSNMDYESFLTAYREIIRKACGLLAPGSLACFVVKEIRKKDGGFVGFVPDTISAFRDAGMQHYNDAVFITSAFSACMVARKYMNNKKLASIHQNVLVFRKPKVDKKP